MVAKEASRLVLMNEGQIVADGSPRDVLALDLCQELGVGIPKATQVYRYLRERRVNLPRVPLSGEELAMLVKEAATR
jgi:ABC-type hemin transport system ATPase subunit